MYRRKYQITKALYLMFKANNSEGIIDYWLDICRFTEKYWKER